MPRRRFLLSLLIAPIACPGCDGADAVVVDTKTGEKRSRKMEELKSRAESQRKSSGSARRR
jgi:hypothetical protein